MILALRTDKPIAELYLANSGTGAIIPYHWEAHRQLADTIHHEIEAILHANNQDWRAISGIIVYKGPGSFTGLRIGITVANTLAYASSIPIVGASGDNWLQDGMSALSSGSNEKLILPEYGGQVHITENKK